MSKKELVPGLREGFSRFNSFLMVISETLIRRNLLKVKV